MPMRWGDSQGLEDARSRPSVDPDLRVKFLRHDSVDVTDSDQSSAENPWITRLSRNKSKKRKLISPGAVPSDHQARGPSTSLNNTGKPTSLSNNNSPPPARGRARSKLYGKSTSDMRIQAAKDLTRRKYFYVGNLAESCSEEALKTHLQSIGVPTLKCNSTTSKFKNCAAFHVCIDAQYLTNFLNSENWPQHTVIREWFFKKKPNKTDENVEHNDAASRAPATETGASTYQLELMEAMDAPTESQLSQNGDSN